MGLRGTNAGGAAVPIKPKRKKGQHGPYLHTAPSVMPLGKEEIAWAGGFIEGEGCFVKSRSGSVGIQIGQAYTREPLDRIRAYLGGSVRPFLPKMAHGRTWLWCVWGPRAREAYRLVSKWLSTRRQAQAQRKFQ